MSNPWDGQSGYMPMIQGSTAQNPWEPMVQGDGAAAMTGMQQGQINLTSQANQMQAYSQQSAPYPSFPNSAGLGSQTAYAPAPTPQAPAMGMPGQGTNPWMLQGEALAR